MSNYTEYPKFIEHHIGDCSNCPESEVPLCAISDDVYICQECFENETTLCSVCGELWISDSIDFYYDEDDNPICEYCYEDMNDEDEFEEDED